MKTRYCRKCESRLSGDRYFNCKACIPNLTPSSEWDIMDSFEDLFTTTEIIHDPNLFKSCKVCLNKKHVSLFYSRDSAYGRIYQSNCKDCTSLIKRERTKKAKEDKNSEEGVWAVERAELREKPENMKSEITSVA